MKEIKELPYVDRRIVVIAPKDRRELNKSNVDWEKAKSVGITVASLTFPFGILLGSVAGALIGEVLKSNFTKQEIPQEDASLEKDYRGIIAMETSSAISQLEFPPGHPITDHAYVGHPLIPTRYIPSAVFHSTLFEEKVNELVTLLASLGATRVKVMCRKGYRSLYGVDAGIETPVNSAGIDAGVSSERHIQQSAVFEEHFRPTEKIYVPDDLLWLGYEHSWQSLANRRLKFGTTKFQVSLKYEDDYGINANMNAGLESIGFKLGGQFSDFESTAWEFEGEFE